LYHTLPSLSTGFNRIKKPRLAGGVLRAPVVRRGCRQAACRFAYVYFCIEKGKTYVNLGNWFQYCTKNDGDYRNTLIASSQLHKRNPADAAGFSFCPADSGKANGLYTGTVHCGNSACLTQR
jgi:hypothetical protein